jgi:hypothetical protein
MKSAQRLPSSARLAIKILVALAMSASTCVPHAFADQIFVFNGVPWQPDPRDPLGLLGTQLSGTATVSCAASICADGTYSFASGNLSVVLSAGTVTLVTSTTTIYNNQAFVTIVGGTSTVGA